MISCNSINLHFGQAAILIGSQREFFPAVAHCLAESFSRGATVDQLQLLPDPDKTKLCGGPCGEVRPLTEFHVDSRSPDGRNWQCKYCENARGRAKHARSPERHIWRGMIKRCHDPLSQSYGRYGGEGISVADEWRGEGGFECWLAYIGMRPSSEYSIDRFPNPKGNYEPGNVRWATDEEQNRNRGDYNRLLTFNDETKTLAEWSETTGFSSAAIQQRLDVYGFSVERALTEPLHPNGKARFVTFDNRTQRVSEWAKELGVHHNTFSYRLDRYPLEKAFHLSGYQKKESL